MTGADPLLRVARLLSRFDEGPHGAAYILPRGRPAAHADANYVALHPASTTDPAFAGTLDCADRGGGNCLAFGRDQHLVEDDVVEYLEAFAPEFFGELPGAFVQPVYQIVDA